MAEVQSPPLSIALFVHQAAPGIWQAFISAASRGLIPGSILTSWWRSPATNQLVGGDRQSQHLVGLAFDAFHPDQSALLQSLASVGFITLPSLAGAVHAQAFPAGVLAQAGVFESLGL